jgi:hypothetical protein
MLQEVNAGVGADRAKERGVVIEEMTRRGGGRTTKADHGDGGERQTRAVSGTVFADGRPRIVNIKGIRMDAEFGRSMIYITVTSTSPASSAASRRRWATPASTSRPSTSGVGLPAAMPSRRSRSMATCRRSCLRRCAPCRRCGRRGR